MPDILLFDWRLDKAIANEPTLRFDPRYIPIPELPLKVMLDAPPPTFAMLQKDPLLHQILVEECRDAFVTGLRNVVLRLKFLDDECGRSNDFYKFAETRKNVMSQIDSDLENAKRDASMRIDRRWVSLQQQKAQYKSYRLGVGVKIIKGVGGVATAGIGIAGAVPTGGASLALSIVGAYRAVMEAGTALYDCTKDADDVQKKVESGLKSLKDTYSRSHTQGVLREGAASTVNALFKVPLTNVKTLEDDNKLWLGKLTHLRFLAHELSNQLNELLTNADRLKAQVSSPKVQAALTKIQKDVNLLLTNGYVKVSMGRRVTIQKSHQEAERGLAAQAQVTKAIDDLKASRSGGVDWYDKIISFVTEVSLFGGGMGSAPETPSVTEIVKESKDSLAALHEIVADAIPQVKAVEERVKKAIQTKVQGAPIAAPKTL